MRAHHLNTGLFLDEVFEERAEELGGRLVGFASQETPGSRGKLVQRLRLEPGGFRHIPDSHHVRGIAVGQDVPSPGPMDA
jgi:hypothetical protein